MRMLIPRAQWSWPVPTASDVFDDFDRVMDGFFRPELRTTGNYDVEETKDHYLISLDMPGVKKEDLNIEVKENTLTVSGERKSSWKDEKSYGKVRRTFTLPENADFEKIEAHYQDGVLEIAVPKTAAAQSRKIEIQSGKSGFFSRLLGGKNEKDIKLAQ